MKIRILGVSLDRFACLAPDPLAVLPSSIAEPWSASHEGLKKTGARMASLAGVWLLWQSGADAVLGYTENGKPILSAQAGAYAVSITHTARYAFCAVAYDGRAERLPSIGLDAEELGGREETRMKAIAERWFSDLERSRLEQDMTEERFLEIWTKKEALVKCTGEGMRGLHAADTEQAAYSFAHFSRGNVHLSLAYPDGLIPPHEIEMM